MIEVRQTAVFQDWFQRLADRQAASRISKRIGRLELGLLGDVKPVGEGISELRIDHGPGYRLYFVQRGKRLIFLLCGGDKSTQAKDIKTAKAMADDL